MTGSALPALYVVFPVKKIELREKRALAPHRRKGRRTPLGGVFATQDASKSALGSPGVENKS